MKGSIDSFTGAHRFLSNFYPCQVKYEGILYPTAEHAFQAAKTKNLTNRKLIASMPHPRDAKAAGRTLKLREGWNDGLRDKVMTDILSAKFKAPGMADALISTYPRELREGNTWNDTYWGQVLRDGEWVGENKLGILLMNLRTDIVSASTIDGGDLAEPDSNVVIVEQEGGYYQCTLCLATASVPLQPFDHKPECRLFGA